MFGLNDIFFYSKMSDGEELGRGGIKHCAASAALRVKLTLLEEPDVKPRTDIF